MRHPVVEQDFVRITASPLPWETLYGKTVLVTGASGFIAGYLTETLLYLNENRDHDPIRVVGLVRDEAKARARFSDYTDSGNLTFLVQDVRDQVTLADRADYVIHAASFATPAKYGTDPVGTLLPNVLGTYSALEYARRSQAAGFLFVSSGEVYGALPPKTGRRICESNTGSVDPMSVRSCYGESKRMGETMCASYFHQYGIPVTVARLFHTYGPSMALGDGRVHSDFLDDAVHGRDITVKGDGRAVRAFCYIADTVSALFTVLLAGAAGQAYNVGSDKPVSVAALADAVSRLPDGAALHVRHELTDRGTAYLASPAAVAVPDTAKIRQLGWQPSQTLVTGLDRTFRFFTTP
jgi:UDP-glucuronate decarboxylase